MTSLPRCAPGAGRAICACAVAVLAISLSAATSSLAAGATAIATATATAAAWPYPNGTVTNTRDAAGSAISSQNVATLRETWSFKLSGKAASTVGGYGTLAANPIVANGVVYVQDLHSNVYALNFSTGKLEWEYKVGQKVESGPGPNGVAVVGTTVYGLAPTSAFALDAKTGRRIWLNDKLLTKGEGTFGIQPQVATGRVYLASQYGSGPGGGVLMALDASTGALLWRFSTLAGADPGVEALGVGAGGAWETPLVGADGSVTYGIGNPYQRVGSALHEPARLLYTDSVVNLTAATGKLRWYYQGVPDDFKDYDMQASPIAATANGVPVVIGAGKMGYVYEMNATTGKLLWKTPVGKHNGHDTDSVDALEHVKTPKLPYTFEPGSLGGVLTNLALAGNTLYVVTNDLAFKVHSSTTVDGIPATTHLAGEVEALNLTTGKVEWDTKVTSLPLGAATVSDNLVFTTLFMTTHPSGSVPLDGELIALDRTTGAIVYRHKLPAGSNAPIAVAGNTVIVPVGFTKSASKKRAGTAQVVAYRLP